MFMMNKEEFESVINAIKENLDETTGALISEDLLKIVASYSNALSDIEEKRAKIEELSKTNEDLLKVNGRLFQEIGFDKKEEETEEVKEEEVEDVSIEDIIDEKGELI